MTLIDIGQGHGIASDKSMIHVYTDIVYVAVVIVDVLFREGMDNPGFFRTYA